jgi:hypothetical protein
VLLTIEEYQMVSGTRQNILDLLAMPGIEGVEFTPVKVSGKLFRPAKL